MGDQSEITATAEGNLHIVMLSKKRVAWFVSVQLVRLAIACLLGYGMRVHSSMHARQRSNLADNEPEPHA